MVYLISARGKRPQGRTARDENKINVQSYVAKKFLSYYNVK